MNKGMNTDNHSLRLLYIRRGNTLPKDAMIHDVVAIALFKVSLEDEVDRGDDRSIIVPDFPARRAGHHHSKIKVGCRRQQSKARHIYFLRFEGY